MSKQLIKLAYAIESKRGGRTLWNDDGANYFPLAKRPLHPGERCVRLGCNFVICSILWTGGN